MRDEINIDAPDNRGNVAGNNSGLVKIDLQNLKWGNKSLKKYYTTMGAVSFDRTLMFSAEATKALIYINGGAAVALLAFCGNYIGELDWRSLVALLCFSAGSFVGIWVLCLMYIAQGKFTELKNETGGKFEKSSIVLVILSMALFLSGVVFSTYAINHLRKQRENAPLKKTNTPKI